VRQGRLAFSEEDEVGHLKSSWLLRRQGKKERKATKEPEICSPMHPVLYAKSAVSPQGPGVFIFLSEPWFFQG
jgi:hypothetical protein